VNESMHIFSGIGGGLLSDLIIGHKPIIAVEWDKYCCKVLRERARDWFPDLQVYEGDVRLFDPSEYTGRIYTIHAGFPCQDISNAGKQAGVGEGTRSGLYREVLRIADVVRPEELFLENVSAILSNGLGTVLGDLAALGYDARWCCLRASDVGANHRRDRWWLLARNVGNPASNGRWCTRRRVDGNIFQEKEWKESTNKIKRSSENDSEKLADSSNQGLQRCETTGNNGIDWQESRDEQSTGCRVGNQWNEVESCVGRVANDVSDRMGKLKGLGNAMVPLQCAVAYSILESLWEK